MLPIDVDVIGGGAHAHYLAKDMRMTATMPDGATKDLMKIPAWDFNWQERYYFKQAVRLPKGTRLDVEISYDNSAENPNNPNSPPKRVRFGQQSTDEMGSMSIEIAPVRDNLPDFAGAVQQHLQTRPQRLVESRRAGPAFALTVAELVAHAQERRTLSASVAGIELPDFESSQRATVRRLVIVRLQRRP